MDSARAIMRSVTIGAESMQHASDSCDVVGHRQSTIDDDAKVTGHVDDVDRGGHIRDADQITEAYSRTGLTWA